MIRKLLGAALIVAGVCLGVYVGLVVLFIGGIIDVVRGAEADPADATRIAWGIVKALVLAEGTGALVAFVVAGIGTAVFGSRRTQRSHSYGRGRTAREVEREWQQRGGW